MHLRPLQNQGLSMTSFVNTFPHARYIYKNKMAVPILRARFVVSSLPPVGAEAAFVQVADINKGKFIHNHEFNVALRSYFLSPASEPQLTTSDEVHATIRGLKVSKAAGSNSIPNRALKHLPSERFPSSPISSTRFSAPITFHKRRSMLE